MSLSHIIGILIFAAMFGALTSSTLVTVIEKLFANTKLKQGIPIAVMVIIIVIGAIAAVGTVHSIIDRIQFVA